jgi:hypothetical protein
MSAAWAAGSPALALHRARTQARLLVAVTATALVALTVLAVCGLLLTEGRRDALDAGLAAAGASGTQVVARVVPVSGTDAATATALAADAEALVTAATDPLGSTSSVWTESPLLALPGGGFAYLADAPDVADAARLVDGRWPAASDVPDPAGPDRAEPDRAGPDAAVLDVAVPVAAADVLGLAVSDVLDLAPSPDADLAPAVTRVRVVGVFAPLGLGDPGTPVWARDLLGGLGAVPDHDRPGTSGRQTSPAAGPFVVAPGGLAAAGTGVGVVSVVVRPVTAGASITDLRAVADASAGLRSALDDALGERVDRDVVRTTLRSTVSATAQQHAVTGAAVLTAGLVGIALAGAAMLLAGRLLTARRATERALLLDRGAAGRQLVGLALLEAVALVLLAAVLAVPLALLAYRGLTSSTLLAASGIAPVDGVPAALVGTVLAGAAVLVIALAVPAARPAGGRRAAAAAGRRLARSGGDLLLVALAVLAAVRLRQGGAPDAVRVLAPVLALVAASVVVLRVVPLLGRLAERGARRSRRFVLPLAALDAARRPRAATALLLLVLAAAGATSGASWAATWSRSQTEQAEALVPAAVVASDVPGAPAAQGDLVRGAADGDALPVTHRATGLGTLVVAVPGSPEPRLVAVDTRAAGLTGRLPAGTTWPGLTAGLAPARDDVPAGPRAAAGLPVAAGGAELPLRVTGTTTSAYPMTVLPTVVLDDGHGVRVRALGTEVPLDGAERVVRVPTPTGLGADDDVRVVAVLLTVTTDVPLDDGVGGVAEVAVDVAWDRPGDVAGVGSAADGPGWTAGATPPSLDAQSVSEPAVDAGPGALRATADVSVSRASFLPAVAVLTAFAPPVTLPVVVSADLAAGAGIGVDDRLDVLVGGTALPAVVTAVAPYVPGAVGGPAVLADARTLSEVALGRGEATALVDRWWLPAGADVDALRAAGAETTVRADTADDLRAGPLRAGVLAALALLVVGALALALIGAALHAAETAEDRGPEIARLLALGASPRAVAGTHVVQHVVVDLLAVAAGTGAGAAVARALAPALTVSPDGGRPVPEALPVWSWPVTGVLVAVLLIGSAAVVLPAVAGLVRRASAAHLRLGDAE